MTTVGVCSAPGDCGLPDHFTLPPPTVNERTSQHHQVFFQGQRGLEGSPQLLPPFIISKNEKDMLAFYLLIEIRKALIMVFINNICVMRCFLSATKTLVERN